MWKEFKTGKESNTDVIQQEYQRRGATVQQLTSKTYDITEEMFQDGSMARLVGEYEDEKAAKAAMMLRKEREASERTLSQIKEATVEVKKKADKLTVTDKTLIESLNMYSEILQRTKDTVGDDMTEQTWIKAIDAASYGMWRAIMGPKFDEGRRR